MTYTHQMCSTDCQYINTCTNNNNQMLSVDEVGMILNKNVEFLKS